MEIIKTTALITINATLVVQLIGFLIFLFIINRVMFRPVRRNMAARDARLTALAEEIANLRAELDAMVARTRDEEQQYIREAHRQGEARRHAGRQEAENMMARTRLDIEVRRNASRAQLDQALAAARAQIASESRQVAREVITRLLAPETAP
jgi:F-type H+-transporting ATPase subunit b